VLILLDETQDSEQEAQNLAREKEWILSRHIDTLDLMHILSNFPEISVVSTCFDAYLVLDLVENIFDA